METTLSLLHSINDRMGTLCKRLHVAAEDEVPRISVRDALNDIQLALEEELRERDDEPYPGDGLEAMDRN